MRYLGIWIFLLQITQSVPAPDIPDSPGVYYRQENGKWVSLPNATVAKTTTKGLGLFVETGGYTNLETDVVCRGAKAVTRVTGPRPTFFIRKVGSSGDVALIQLTQKKDSRSFHKSSADATVENKVGARKEAIKKTAVKAYAEDFFSIRPEVDLKPGEYLLIISDVGDAATSFDFGIDQQK